MKANKKNTPAKSKKSNSVLFFNPEIDGSITGIYNGRFESPNNAKKKKGFKDQYLIKIGDKYVNLTSDIESKLMTVKDELKPGKTVISIRYIETLKLDSGNKFKVFSVIVNKKEIEKEFEFTPAQW